ncbi:MAG: hypothetical protein HPY65_18340 [Syntrophaceae bacterium]|nr:hypothetical protein [Syntrophaceae bacterium]
MPTQFKLIYGYVHCRGRTSYTAGYVDTAEEAEVWVRQHESGTAPAMKIPPGDPVRSCLAAHCPFKRQKPWFSYLVHSE